MALQLARGRGSPPLRFASTRGPPSSTNTSQMFMARPDAEWWTGASGQQQVEDREQARDRAVRRTKAPCEVALRAGGITAGEGLLAGGRVQKGRARGDGTSTTLQAPKHETSLSCGESRSLSSCGLRFRSSSVAQARPRGLRTPALPVERRGRSEPNVPRQVAQWCFLRAIVK